MEEIKKSQLHDFAKARTTRAKDADDLRPRYKGMDPNHPLLVKARQMDIAWCLKYCHDAEFCKGWCADLMYDEDLYQKAEKRKKEAAECAKKQEEEIKSDIDII